jgi:hypothetical protein
MSCSPPRPGSYAATLSIYVAGCVTVAELLDATLLTLDLIG